MIENLPYKTIVFFPINRRMKTSRVRDMVALLTFPITTSPELYRHYHDM